MPKLVSLTREGISAQMIRFLLIVNTVRRASEIKNNDEKKRITRRRY